MTGTIHKLTAGTGYEYLTRQVAAMDATDKGKVSLADYYSAKGESPGRWMGSGLPALAESSVPTPAPPAAVEARTIATGDVVSAAQMKALFGEGRHPNADAITEAFVAEGASATAALAQSKLGAEFGDYTKQPDFVVALAEKFRDHNRAAGNDWKAPIDPETRAELRTELARERFTERYDREPRDDRELSSFLVTQTRKKQNAVAGYDMTFTPVKSISALWAVAPLEMSQALEECHDKAVADALAFVEREACLSRLGADGVAQVDTDGMIAAGFIHRDSRAGDPNLHTHVTISNKVRVTDAAGETKWMALDGRPLFKATVTASEVYNSRLEMYTASHDQLRLQFAERASADARKRPIREVVGVPEGLCTAWSTRRAQITVRVGELSRQFQADHRREPTSSEAFELAQQATLETRDAKHEPRSLAEQRQTWRTEAEAVLGGPESLTALVAEATGATRVHRSEPLTDAEREQFAAKALHTVSTSRARWQRPHIRAEAERLLRAQNFLGLDTDAAISAAVEAIADTALGPEHAITVSSDALDGELNEPDVLRRADGSSVYTTHDTALFTTESILSAERRIVAASRRTDGRRVDDATVEVALLERAANGRELNAGQADMVRQLATTGRRVHPVIAPAGTGKTTAMATFAAAWTDSGGQVIGLAPTAAAAKVLGADLGAPTDTLAKLVHLVEAERFYDEQQRLAKTPRWKTVTNSELRADVERARTGLANGTIKAPTLPDWYRDLDATSVVIIDEAGMAGTADLDVAIGHVMARGGKVCPVGDDQQLSSISAGGVMRDIAHETGALTLTQVVRFSDAAEGAASLAVRDGDAAGLGYYADRGRIHVAADDVAADQAYTAWATDRADGRDTHMLAATRETVNELNARARADRLAEDPTASRAAVDLSDGLQAGVGDIICSRRNKRSLQVTATDWVRNGDRWVVTGIGDDGSITAQHLDLHRSIALPADYVTDNVTLGYASTIHGAQGLTADTCHVVGSDALTRQLLYVAMTRGRHGNHIYFSTAETDPHKVTTPKAVSPKTGLEVLTAVLGRDDAQQSATTAARTAIDPFTRLRHVAATYTDAVGTAAEHTLGADALAALDADATAIYAEATGADPDTIAALREQPAWPTLRHHLARIELDNGDARARLRAAIGAGELDTAADPAAVLDYRLDSRGTHSTGRGPLPWQPAIPARLDADPAWGPYLRGRAELVGDLADRIRADVATWDPATAPRWARPYLLADPTSTNLVADLAVYRAATGVDDTDRRPAGPEHRVLVIRAAGRTLTRRATAVVDVSGASARWKPLAEEITPELLADPYWPELAEQLSTAARAGLPVHDMVRTAVPADNPLPTEMPAAALWWRLAGDLGPATVAATGTGLRPDWINALPALVGDRAATALVADPAWPGLVAAVSAADPNQWTPTELLGLADELLHAGADDDHHVRLDEYARALTWRVDLLITAPAIDAPLPDAEPLSPDDEERAAAAAGIVDPDTAVGEYPAPETAAPVDDGYLDALAATEPPPDIDLEPDVDYYPDLAFDDFTTTAPTTVARDTAPIDIAAAIADRYELLAQLADATHDRDTLTAAITDGNGPHTLATAGHIIAMRTKLDAQRPAAGDVATAQAELDDAQHRLDELTTQAAELRGRAAELRATPAEATSDLDDVDSPDIAALRLDADATMLDMQIDAARTHRDAFATDYADAQQRLEAAVAVSGGQRVTAADVDAVARMADSLDTTNLNEARQHVRELADRLWRIDMRLARHHAGTETAHHDRAVLMPAPAQPAPEPAVDTAPVAETAAVAPPVLSGVAALPDAEVATEITRARRMLARLDDDTRQLRRLDPDRGRATDTVRADHARLRELAPRVRAALAATTALDDARTQHAETTTALTAARRDLDTAKRRDRPAAQARVDDLTAELTRTTRVVETARTTADITTAAVDVAPHNWAATIARAADTVTLTDELDTARRADESAAAIDTRAAANRERYTTRLAELRAEQQRRSVLPAVERDAEDLARTRPQQPESAQDESVSYSGEAAAVAERAGSLETGLDL